MEGDTTAFYINKKLAGYSVKISSIARGIPVGGDLEYADEITLGRSIVVGRCLGDIPQPEDYKKSIIDFFKENEIDDLNDQKKIRTCFLKTVWHLKGCYA